MTTKSYSSSNDNNQNTDPSSSARSSTHNKIKSIYSGKDRNTSQQQQQQNQQDKTGGAEQFATDSFNKVKDQIEDFTGDLKERAQNLTEGFQDNVKNNPWIYVGGIAAAALVVGFFIGRRQNSSSRS